MVPFKFKFQAIKQKMRFMVSYLQLSRLGFEYDKARPDKITVTADKKCHLWGEETDRKEDDVCWSAVFRFKGHQIHPNEFMPDSLQLDKSTAKLNYYCYINSGDGNAQLALSDVAKDNHHDHTQLAHHGRFRLNDLLAKFTDSILRQKSTNYAPHLSILEITSNIDKFQLGYELAEK